MNNYIKILRLDHWIKQLFIVPGIVVAIIMVNSVSERQIWGNIIIGFFATCLIASANYAINEYLDAEFDRFHPTKKYRPVVTENINGNIVGILWLFLSIAGIALGYMIGKEFSITLLWLWFMGIVYNVKPLRTKDIPILDVCSESINNAIRFLLGWFIVTNLYLPPCSIVIGYWMGGAFLMAMKRFAEYRMIGNPEIAGLYRKSFTFYTEKSLMLSSFVYALLSVFFCGIFLIKYRMELILFIPFFIGLFAYYFYKAFDDDSAVQKPEKLFHEKGLMIYCAALILIFIILMVVDIPILMFFGSNELIRN